MSASISKIAFPSGSEQHEKAATYVLPYGKQSIDDADIAAVVSVLKSDYITQGPAIEQFETDVSLLCHSAYAIATNNATSALHLACLALGVGPGDRVWTSPISFVASANCALYCGASIDFVDIDPDTYNLSILALERKLFLAKQKDCLPKVVIPVHLCGQACDMDKLQGLAQQYGFSIIEDASHAIGGSYKDQPIGNCAYSDITVFSFHPVKIITSAEGGMLLTNSNHLAQQLQQLRSHGITRDETQMTEPSHGPWYYQQLQLGFNYRMNDIQASLGASQLKKISGFVERRREIASFYDEKLAGLPIQLPYQHPDTQSAWHLYVIRLQQREGHPDHRQVITRLRELGIGVNLHYIPIHLQPYFQKLGFRYGDFPQAEQYYQEAISLPIFPRMTEQDQFRVVSALKEILVT